MCAIKYDDKRAEFVIIFQSKSNHQSKKKESNTISSYKWSEISEMIKNSETNGN